MKRFVYILFSVFFGLSVNAQVRQEVIASAGGYNANRDVSLSWTLGETIVPTFKSQDGTLILTNGIQQKLLITAVKESLNELVKIKVFPNPSTEIVKIKFDVPVDEEIVLDVLDSQGKIVKTDIIKQSLTEKQINLQDISAGIYYLRLSNGKVINVYKVVKL